VGRKASKPRLLIATPLLAGLVLGALLWLLLPDVRLAGGETIYMSFDEQRSLLERLGVESGCKYYVIALSTCPWCALQLRFFEERFKGEYSYCYIDKDKSCHEALLDLSGRSGGLISGVPVTLVLRDGRITAIVLGYKDDEALWRELAQAEATESIPINPTTSPQLKVKTALALIPITLGALVTLALYIKRKG